jgi:flagellar L-ring protein FlgH
MKRIASGGFLLALCIFAGSPTFAAGPPQDDSWSFLASDRSARKVGDVLTVVVYENSTAVNSANSDLEKSSSFGGRIQAGTSFDKSASLNLGDGSENSGTTSRSGRMVAQITAVVDEVLPNGDLRITGSQDLNINGERTNIRIKGRVRTADISSDNSVLSSRLADATIDYDGQGFVSRSAKPGILTQIFNWLGIP